MAKCSNFYYSGVGACTAFRDPLAGMIIMTKGTTITEANAAILGSNTTGWASIINPPTAQKGLYVDITRGIEDTSEDAELTTSNLGLTEKTNQNPPKFTAMGVMSYEDYQLWLKADGKEFDIALVTRLGNVLLTPTTTSGTHKGLRAKIFTKPTVPQVGAELQKQAPFYVMFTNLEEWENMVEIDTGTVTCEALKDLNPVGCTGKVSTAYNSGTGVVIVKVTNRNGATPITTMGATTNWEVLEAPNDTTVTIGGLAGSDEGIGIYSLTLPASLNGPVYVRGYVATASALTYTTQPIKVV